MTHATNADDHTSHADNKEKNNRSFTILFFDFSLRDQSIDRSKLASMYTFKRIQKNFFLEKKKKEQLLNCSMIKKRRRQNMCIICIYMYIRRRKRMQARIEGKNKKLLLASPNSNIRAR